MINIKSTKSVVKISFLVICIIVYTIGMNTLAGVFEPSNEAKLLWIFSGNVCIVSLWWWKYCKFNQYIVPIVIGCTVLSYMMMIHFTGNQEYQEPWTQPQKTVFSYGNINFSYYDNFAKYYFGDRQIVVDENYIPKGGWSNRVDHIKLPIVVDVSQITTGEAINISEEQAKWILQNEHVVQHDTLFNQSKQNIYYIMDLQWQKSDSIVMAYNGNNSYFIPKILLDECMQLTKNELLSQTTK